MYERVSKLLHLLLLTVGLGAFGSSLYFINTEPRVSGVAVPTLTPTAISSIPAAFDGLPDTGWALLQPGLERRVIQIYDDQDQQVESVYVWRLDQRYFRLDVAFDRTPKTLESWQRETDAAMVVNGGFYSIENERYFPDGLIVLDGQASGRSFSGHGGMLAIDEDRAELRWLVDQPYSSAEPFQAALQSFPMLVKPGGLLGFGAERENHANARRTVVAQDREGRILFIVTPRGHFTLHQLSVWLTNSDLNLDIALNLDGGGSTGIVVADPREVIPTTRPVPFVILVYPR